MGPEEAPRQGEPLGEAGRAAVGGGEAEEAFLANPVKGAVLGEDWGEVLAKQKKREIFKKQKDGLGEMQCLLPTDVLPEGLRTWPLETAASAHGQDLACWGDEELGWEPDPWDAVENRAWGLRSPRQPKGASAAARGPRFLWSSWASQRMEVLIWSTSRTEKSAKIC